MRTFALLVSAGLASTILAQAPDSNPPTRYLPLEREAGGTWMAHWNPATQTPRSIYGTGLAIEDWRENSLNEARRHAGEALKKYGHVLGLGDSEFRESIGARMGRTWSFKFDQYYRGLPCIGGRADVRVNMS
ncbi:MAG: hypothetical protein VYE77_09870, partial [Planctomycetota bacterium]|nr:hypothetical protein [Planctomycetota bacterium]